MRLCVCVAAFVTIIAGVAGAGSGAASDYLGQTPPGDEPVLFAPGVVSVDGRYEYGVAFSPAGDELFFTGEYPEGADAVAPAGLLVMRKTGGRWSQPVVANLRGDDSWEQEAFYTTDGRKLFFCSPVAERKWKLWFAERQGGGWGAPRVLESPVNDADIVFYATFTDDGTMYYTDVTERTVYRAKRVGGAYPATEPAGLAFGGHSFVYPTGDCLLLDGKQDLWVVYDGGNGSWTEPIRLGDGISTESVETCPSLSPDGKYIFFSRYNEPGEISNIYWVASDIIGRLDPRNKTEHNKE